MSQRVSCIRKGAAAITEVDFESIKAGDTVFTRDGFALVVGEDAHRSGDASYDGWLLYDADGDAQFPEDLVAGVKPYVITTASGSEFYLDGAVHIERNDMLYGTVAMSEEFDDEDAAKAAERDGIRLIRGMKNVPDGVYLDTAENRVLISAASKPENQTQEENKNMSVKLKDEPLKQGPLSLAQMREMASKYNGFVKGAVFLDANFVVREGFDTIQDAMSEKLTGSPLLAGLEYEFIPSASSKDSLCFEVLGDATAILEMESADDD